MPSDIPPMPAYKMTTGMTKGSSNTAGSTLRTWNRPDLISAKVQFSFSMRPPEGAV